MKPISPAIKKVIANGGCYSMKPTTLSHSEMDEYGKANGFTVTFAAWHPEPGYAIFKTGSLCSGNDKFPSGLVIVNERGIPNPWKSEQDLIE